MKNKISYSLLLLFSVLFINIQALSTLSFQHKSNHYKKISMEMIVQEALKYRPNLEALTFEIKANNAAAKAELGGYYPTITLESSLSQETGQKSPANSSLINLNQLLYSFAGPHYKYARAKHTAGISVLEKITQSNLIRLITEKAFLQAWLIQKQYDVITALKESSSNLFEFQKHEHFLGLSDKNVWLKNAEDYGFTLAQIKQYNNSLNTAFATLRLLTGNNDLAPKSTELSWLYKKKYSLLPLQNYYDAALATRPEIKQGMHRIEIEQQNRKLAQGGRLPTFSAFGQVGRIDRKLDTRTSHHFHAVGLNVSWLLFDGLVFQHQEQQADAQKVKEMLLREQTILDIKQEVQEKYYVMSNAIIQRDAQKINYIRNDNEFKLKKQHYDLGLISSVDFDQAKTAWKKAMFDWLNQNIIVANAQSDLNFACGYPETSIFSGF